MLKREEKELPTTQINIPSTKSILLLPHSDTVKLSRNSTTNYRQSYTQKPTQVLEISTLQAHTYTYTHHVCCRQMDRQTDRRTHTRTHTILQVNDKGMSNVNENVSLHLGPNTITNCGSDQVKSMRHVIVGQSGEGWVNRQTAVTN